MKRIVAIALAIVAAAPATAELLEQCLDEAMSYPDGGEACLYVVYDDCKAESGDDSTAGEVGCLGAEVDAWDRVLNESWADLRQWAEDRDAEDAGGGDAHVAALLAAQRTWLDHRDAECAWEYQRYAAGTLRSVIGASCMLTMTAKRALEFRDWLADGN